MQPLFQQIQPWLTPILFCTENLQSIDATGNEVNLTEKAFLQNYQNETHPIRT